MSRAEMLALDWPDLWELVAGLSSTSRFFEMKAAEQDGAAATVTPKRSPKVPPVKQQRAQLSRMKGFRGAKSAQ